jgi:hypothetical protein
MDTSYLFAIVARMIWKDHPEVMFKPGPFFLGEGILGWTGALSCPDLLSPALILLHVQSASSPLDGLRWSLSSLE